LAVELFRNIMLVMDGGEGCMEAARVAVELARESRSKLHVAATVDTETLTRLLQRHILVEDERISFQRELEHDAERYLKHVEQLAKSAGVETVPCLLRGSIHQTVLHEAESRKVELIVLGGWMHSMLKREIIPRERQMILDGAHCNVLVVKGTAE